MAITHFPLHFHVWRVVGGIIVVMSWYFVAEEYIFTIV